MQRITVTGKHPITLRSRDSAYIRRKVADRLAMTLILLAALAGVAALVVILGYVIVNGAPALNLDFFTKRPLPYGEVGGGVAPAIMGTSYMLAIASLIGIPAGIGTAIYLSEYGHGRFAALVSFVVDLIAGLPSIVIGVFVWSLLVRHLVGQSAALAGSAPLAIIMTPIVTRTVEEILRLLPDSLREGALALGAPRWRMILQVVVLSLARAGGETAPLLLTALGNQFFSLDL